MTNVELGSQGKGSSISASDGKPDGKKKNKEEQAQTAHQQELEQDSRIDPAPFAFKPFQLAHMLDPKSLPTLISFGGIQGLLDGLGTSSENGLMTGSLPRANTTAS